jgi:ABC-type transporter Mla MlaB component
MARKSAPAPAPPSRPLALEGDLDLFSIHAQWESTQALLPTEGTTIEIDLSGIGDLDLSGVQLLSALDRDFKARNGRLVLIGAKPDWTSRFETLGLANLFEGKAP